MSHVYVLFVTSKRDSDASSPRVALFQPQVHGSHFITVSIHITLNGIHVTAIPHPHDTYLHISLQITPLL